MWNRKSERISWCFGHCVCDLWKWPCCCQVSFGLSFRLVIPVWHFAPLWLFCVWFNLTSLFVLKNRVNADFKVSCKGAHNPHPSSISRELSVHNWEVKYAPSPDNIYWWVFNSQCHTFRHPLSVFRCFTYCQEISLPSANKKLKAVTCFQVGNWYTQVRKMWFSLQG